MRKKIKRKNKILSIEYNLINYNYNSCRCKEVLTLTKDNITFKLNNKKKENKENNNSKKRKKYK